MSIRIKLLVLVMTGILAALAIFACGYVAQKRLAADIGNIETKTIPGIETLAKARGTVFRLRGHALEYLVSSSQDQLTVAKTIADEEALLTRTLTDYEKLAASDEDRRLLETDRSTIHDWQVVRNSMLDAFSRGDRAQADDYRRQAGAKLKTAVEAINQHIAFNDRQADAERKNAEHFIVTSELISLAVLAAAIAVLASVGYVVYRAVMRPLKHMNEEMVAIGRTLDFTRRTQVHTRDEVGQTVNAFNHLIGTLQTSFRQLIEHAREVGGATQQLAQNARLVSNSASVQSDASSSAAATIEQLTVSINHVGDRAGSTNTQSVEAGALAHSGHGVVVESADEVRKVEDQVQLVADSLTSLREQIGEISRAVMSIKDVATQTNLLALNAAIEAARAGEQGRGFSVVADEVRKLADRTTTMTTDIDRLTSSILANTDETTQTMLHSVEMVRHSAARASHAAEIMDEIRDASQSAVGMVSEISLAIREQGVAGNQIAAQVEQISRMAEEASAAARDTASTADRLQASSQRMQDIISAYTV